MSKQKVEMTFSTELLKYIDRAAEAANMARTEFIAYTLIEKLEALNLLKIKPFLSSPCQC